MELVVSILAHLKSALELSLDIARLVPWLLPVTAATAYGLLSTQHYKFELPRHLHKAERDRRIRTAAFYRYFIPCIMLWPVGWDWPNLSPIDWYAVGVYGLITAAILGFSSITIYRVLMHRLYKIGWLDPERWSADVLAYKEDLREAVKEQLGVLPDSELTIFDLTKVMESRQAPKPEPTSSEVTERLDYLRRSRRDKSGDES